MTLVFDLRLEVTIAFSHYLITCLRMLVIPSTHSSEMKLAAILSHTKSWGNPKHTS